MLVPCIISFAVSVLNIEPNDIVRKVKFLKLGVNCLDICLIPVVPPTLMIAKRKGRSRGSGERSRSSAWDIGISYIIEF